MNTLREKFSKWGNEQEVDYNYKKTNQLTKKDEEDKYYQDPYVISKFPNLKKYTPEVKPINVNEITEEENNFRVVYLEELIGEPKTEVQKKLKQVIMNHYTPDVITNMKMNYNVTHIFDLSDKELESNLAKLNQLIK